MKCTICSGEDADPQDGLIVTDIAKVTVSYVCSPSCLVEYAWKLKQDQSKLSKSGPLRPNDFPKSLCAADKHLADPGYPCPECAKETE